MFLFYFILFHWWTWKTNNIIQTKFQCHVRHSRVPMAHTQEAREHGARKAVCDDVTSCGLPYLRTASFLPSPLLMKPALGETSSPDLPQTTFTEEYNLLTKVFTTSPVSYWLNLYLSESTYSTASFFDHTGLVWMDHTPNNYDWSI